MNPVKWILDNHPGTRITSPYGMRDDPINPGTKRKHTGTDIGGKPSGFIWKSPYDGIVTHVGTHSGRGLTVVTSIAGTMELQLFQHLNKALVKKGDTIKQGTPIGENGTTGDVTGPHLHYSIRKDNGTSLGTDWGDPENYTAGGDNMGKMYTVKKGDALSAIAQANGIDSWQLLVEWNKDRYPNLVSNPNLITPGMELRLYDPNAKPEPPKADIDLKPVLDAIAKLSNDIKALRQDLKKGLTAASKEL